MVAAQQYVGYRAPSEHRRAGILRILEQASRMGLKLKALLGRKHARHIARDGIDEYAGRQLSSGNDLIAEGEFLVDKLLNDALVYAFIMAAENDKCIIFSKPARGFLV